MKKIIFYSLILLFISCAKTQLSHVETAQIVVESFYQKDNTKLIQETVNGDTAWVKFTTSYEDKPETFKLVQEDGKWKVTETGLREKGPF